MSKRRNQRSRWADTTRRFRDNIDSLRYAMCAPLEDLAGLGTLTDKGTGYRRRWTENARHIYIDRGSPILGVAHLDSVRSPTHFWLNHRYLSCPTIDNRLGLWVILYGLPLIGITVDVLLTENEEVGASTASDFDPPKEYNWAFSFDRTGTDVACYQYLSGNLTELLKPYDLRATHGSYSDVADLDIGVVGMNFGCGMYNYHSDGAYANLAELDKQMMRFANFYDDHAGLRIPYTPPPITTRRYGTVKVYSGGRWQEYIDTTEDWGDYDLAPKVDLSQHWERMLDAYDARKRASGVDLEDPDVWWQQHAIDEADAQYLFDQELRDDLVQCEYCEFFFEPEDLSVHQLYNACLCRRCYLELLADDGYDLDDYSPLPPAVPGAEIEGDVA